MHMFVTILGIGAAIVVLIGLIFGLEWLGVEWEGFIGPRKAEIQRGIFYKTRSYNEGMIQQLSRYRLQYLRADSKEEKDAIASTVRTMFAEYDLTKLNPELRLFLMEINR